MALIGRIIVIIFALFLASLAAGIVIAMGFFGPDTHAFSGDFGERASFWIVAFFVSGFTGASIGLLPLIVLIAIAEALKIRSLLIYAAAGAAMLAIGYYGGAPTTYEESIDNPPSPISRPAEIAAAGGIVFGLVYWLIAGRKAGRWRER